MLLSLHQKVSAQLTHSILFNQASQSAELIQGTTQTLSDYLATSDNLPVAVKLQALDDSGQVPSWLSINNNLLDGILLSANAEIEFMFDANTLQVGKYYTKVLASAVGYDTATLDVYLTVTVPPPGTLLNIKVNFQDSATAPPSGWLKDYGQAFGLRTGSYQGSGYSYGWSSQSARVPIDITKNTRRRSTPSGALQSTLIYIQAEDATDTGLTKTNAFWEAQAENGNYKVTVSVGDGEFTDSRHTINVEGINVIPNFVPVPGTLFNVATQVVSVTDGFLTIDAIGGKNTKINYVIIQPDMSPRPSVVMVNPPNGSVNVNENASISTSILTLPNGGINNNTITPANVFLSEESTGNLISASVNGTGGGDAITLVPEKPLKLNTTYRFTITSGVKDLVDSSFIPYSTTFTTGSSSNSDTIKASFTTVALPNTMGQHSSLAFGPDGKLYALTIDGVIQRYPVNVDGTLGTPQFIYTLQDEYGARKESLAIGLAFDPASTEDSPIVWVTHSSFVFLNGPDWDGKLSKLWGPDLENIQDVVINLPRSTKDHLTNSIAFGPDGALYFNQGCNSAMGLADRTWNYRKEHLLSAACLRLDVSKIASFPLNAKTPEGGGSYNPYAVDAPLTLYAMGIRNAYDLLWHSNGQLYLPTNGSAAGGNTPASVSGTLRPDGTTYSGPAIPSLTNVQQTQNDYLFKIVKGGYYGHPNPLRGQYVLNGGNPTSSIDPAEVPTYPVGTLPDANYRGYAFNFQNNKSPDGVIEYKSNKFNGALKGKILVVRYSQNKDIIVLTPGGVDNNIISSTEGPSIEGFSGFEDPLDLVEDPANGNIYMSEYGGSGRITLLRAPVAQDTVAVPPAPVRDSTIKTFKIFPNPAQNLFHISFPKSYTGTYHLQLIDPTGRQYDLKKIILNGTAVKVDVDISYVPVTQGIYFLRISSDKEKSEIFKIVIHR